MTRNEVVNGVQLWATWWIAQRRKKLVEQLTETMSVNPFMLPFLFSYHDLRDFNALADLMVSSHLMTGHNTGFGKLIDEKILPNVFNSTKLDSAFRRNTPPFNNSCFDEIDHIVRHQDGTTSLLSLKAGRWTIQLTMAVQLNAAFDEILNDFPDTCDQIVVGVFYGRQDGLTDKYDILRGINRGANHNVIDLQNQVFVEAGRRFWAWLNDGEEDTQAWVLEGIINALEEAHLDEEAHELLEDFRDSVVRQYQQFVNEDGTIDWLAVLLSING